MGSAVGKVERVGCVVGMSVGVKWAKGYSGVCGRVGISSKDWEFVCVGKGGVGGGIRGRSFCPASKQEKIRKEKGGRCSWCK